MKKNLLYLCLLLALGVATWYFVFRDHTPTYSKSEANFTVEDTSAIQSIFLSDLKNNKIKLTRTPGGWVLNDSMKPRPDAVEGLLSVLHKQYPEKPVPASAHDEAIRELSSKSTKVEIYTKEGLEHTFYVDQIATRDNLTIMLMDGAKRPYVVTLPMDNNFVGRRYFTSLSEWRSRHILEGPSPIESVDIAFADSSQYSFHVNVQGEMQYQMSGPFSIPKPLNTRRVHSYLKLLDQIFCMGYETGYMYKDSIVQKTQPFATVKVQRKGQAAETLSLFFKPASHDTKEELLHKGIRYDSNFFFGWLNNHDFIQLNRKTVETLLRRYYEFYEENIPVKK